MVDFPAAIAAQAALTQQAVALSVVKQNAEMAQNLVAMLDQAIANVPVSSTHGAHVNVSA